MTTLSLSRVAVNIKHISLAEAHRPLGWNRAELYTTKITRLIRFGPIQTPVLIILQFNHLLLTDQNTNS